MKSNSWLLVGLGNVGGEFLNTRHNVGFAFVETFAASTPWQQGSNFAFVKRQIDSTPIIALQPQTMMNLSGDAVLAAMKKFKVASDHIIIVVDNVDLPFGTLKFNARLAAGSHNGLKHIAKIAPFAFSIHIGIGRQNPLKQWVLSPFKPAELKQLPSLFKKILNHLEQFWASDNKLPFTHRLASSKTATAAKAVRKLVITGAFFGDEGKGKVVDYYAEKFDIIARFAGGDNAGHTIVVGQQTYQFSLLPVAMIRADKISFLGAGCVLNLAQLVAELETLAALKIPLGKLQIAARAHVVFPYHLEIDASEETNKGSAQIGTTKRGIGPCVADRTNRIGIQLADFFDLPTLKTKLTANLVRKNPLLKQPLLLTEFLPPLLKVFAKIKPYIVDSAQFWAEHHDKSVLFEGAQGTLLDPIYGTYPYVTTTSPLTWQASLGTLAPLHKAQFCGVFKAYLTRVGQGPLPTEIADDDLNNQIAKRGHEYGTVTNRRRRIGWFDAVLARYAIRVNNFQQMALTLLDVLSGLEKIQICTHYLLDGKKLFLPPFVPSAWARVEPQYLTLSGWNQTDFKNVRNFHDLPLNAKRYVEKIEHLLGLPITLLSVGKDRAATLKR